MPFSNTNRSRSVSPSIVSFSSKAVSSKGFSLFSEASFFACCLIAVALNFASDSSRSQYFSAKTVATLPLNSGNCAGAAIAARKLSCIVL